MNDPIKKRKKPLVTWTFKEGRFWDLWMIVHLLSGAALGIFFELTTLGFMNAFLTTLFLAVVWEFVERKYFGVREEIENMIIDVFIALIGFAIAYTLAVPFGLVVNIVIIAVLVLSIAFFNYKGWLAYRRRKR